MGVSIYSGGEPAHKRLEQLAREKESLVKRLKEVVYEEADLLLHVSLGTEQEEQPTGWAKQPALAIPLRKEASS